MFIFLRRATPVAQERPTTRQRQPAAHGHSTQLRGSEATLLMSTSIQSSYRGPDFDAHAVFQTRATFGNFERFLKVIHL